VAQRGPQHLVRYADVALLASLLGDDVAATSLQAIYLAPLQVERDGGAVARQTLRAYFAANRNVSATAARLGVKRHTVTNRLRSVESAVGRPLEACASELEAALEIEELEKQIRPSRPEPVGHPGRDAEALE
jgi:DNA-binding PucR family transcriptional regulator